MALFEKMRFVQSISPVHQAFFSALLKLREVCLREFPAGFQGLQRGSYVFPNVALLDVPPAQVQDDTAWIEEQRQLLDLTLKNFNVRANVVHVTLARTLKFFKVKSRS